MPWIRKGKTVYNEETGKSKGTSTTVAKAKAHMRALYANVPEARVAAMKKHKPRAVSPPMSIQAGDDYS